MIETLEYHYHLVRKNIMILLPQINRQIYGEALISISVFLPHPHRPPLKKTVNYIEAAVGRFVKKTN